MSFPTALSNAIDGVTEIVAAHLNNLEAKVGIDNSAVVTSLDYLLKNTGSIDPGHKHTAVAISGGNNGEVLYKAAGVWGPGTPDAAGLVAKSGDQSIAGIKTFASIPIGPASDPTTGNQLARKAYVDLMLPLAGGTMAGNVAMNNHKVTGLAAASGAGEAVRYDEWIATQDPGHKHSKLWAADGSPEAVTVDANGNVGIRTTSPSTNLTINTPTFTGAYGSYSNERPSILASGNNPYLSIQISSTYNDDNYPNYGLVLVNGPSTSDFDVWGIMHDGPAKTDGGLRFAYMHGTGSGANIHTQTPMVTFQKSGNVGIGTTSPGKKLDVNGYVRGIGIFNTLNSAPADGDLAAGECAWWFDKTNGAAKLMIKAKQNDGTVKTASISLS